MSSAPTLNISRMLRWNVVRRADHEALVDGEVRLTYADLDREVDDHAAALMDAGVGRGEVVGVLARNSATYIIEILALARIGAILVPLNWRLHPRELADIAFRGGITTVIADVEFAESVEAMLVQGPARRVVYHEPGPVRAPATFVLGDLLASARGRRVPDADVGLDDVQRILYTSGTTSLPKGVIHTYGNVLFNQLGQILELELTSRDRLMVSAPLFHVSGLEAPGHQALAAGATLVITRSYAGADIVDLAERERITGLVLAAQIVHDLLDLPDLDRRDLSSLRYCIFGGVPPATRMRFSEAFPGVRLIDTFGMTELTNGACYMDEAHQFTKLGAMGSPFPYVDMRVVRADGRDADDDEVGEILVRSPKVSPGYWRDEAATAASWRDGWFHTGDMGRRDADGFFWFATRVKDMIRSGGENIASAEIEHVISELAGVAEVAVIGVPDPKWDEVPKAYVVVREGQTVSEEDVLEHCRSRLARFKVPKVIEFRDVLPRNDSGKVLKRELRAEIT